MSLRVGLSKMKAERIPLTRVRLRWAEIFCFVALCSLGFCTETCWAKFPEELFAESRVLDLRDPKTFLRIAHDTGLDPTNDGVFVLGVTVAVRVPPEVGRIHTVVQKIADRKPYSGWAFGLTRTATALRPTIYWRDQLYGKGGWYDFDAPHLEKDGIYSFILVAKPGAYLTLYYQPVSVSGLIRTDSDAGQPLSLLSSNYPSSFFSRNESKSVYLGGYSLAGIGAAQSDAPLVVGSRAKRSNAFNGVLSSLLIATPDNLVGLSSFEKIGDELKLGVYSLASSLTAEELRLWIVEGEDRSLYQRALIKKGQVRWTPLSQLAPLAR